MLGFCPSIVCCLPSRMILLLQTSTFAIAALCTPAYVGVFVSNLVCRGENCSECVCSAGPPGSKKMNGLEERQGLKKNVKQPRKKYWTC